MEPEEIRVKVLAEVRWYKVHRAGGVYYADLRNKIEVTFEEMNPVLRILKDEGLIHTRHGINGILIYSDGKKKR